MLIDIPINIEVTENLGNSNSPTVDLTLIIGHNEYQISVPNLTNQITSIRALVVQQQRIH